MMVMRPSMTIIRVSAKKKKFDHKRRGFISCCMTVLWLSLFVPIAYWSIALQKRKALPSLSHRLEIGRLTRASVVIPMRSIILNHDFVSTTCFARLDDCIVRFCKQ